MLLEIAADGRYRATLVIPDNPDSFPAWEYDSTCTVASNSARQTIDVRYVAMVLGSQQGVVDEQGIAGRLSPPIRRGPRTITGEWTFTAPRR
jgi:hypothetical protein